MREYEYELSNAKHTFNNNTLPALCFSPANQIQYAFLKLECVKKQKTKKTIKETVQRGKTHNEQRNIRFLNSKKTFLLMATVQSEEKIIRGLLSQ